jgi:benzoyl-CoA 2,3-dioxygenase component B
MNEILRDAYIDDNQRGVDRWNKIVAAQGIDYSIKLPSRRFNRTMGIYRGHHFDPAGNLLSAEEWERRKFEWLPTAEDKWYVRQLMEPVLEVGKIAQWIAKPERGVKGLPVDYEYVRRV